MAWDTTLVENLRYWINDLDVTAYTWTDTELKKFLCIAAINVIQIDLLGFESLINGPYTIDVSATTISPDPTADATNGFSNLIVMKAACIIARAELKELGSSAGYKIVDDRSTFDGTQALGVARDIAKDYCGAYGETLIAFKQGNVNAGQAILSPYSSANDNTFGFGRGMWFNHWGGRPGGGC